MELLKTFQLLEDGSHIDKTVREACRAVVFDDDNLMPILFVSSDNYHKLPGGGIEGSEDKIEALKREILEETGCEIDDIEEIGCVVEENSTWKQTSYCYIGNIVGKSTPTFTSQEQGRGYALKWVTLDQALSLVESDLPTSLAGKEKQQRDGYILQEIKKYLCI